MKISAIKAVLSGNDIMSILDDFVEIEGLKIENIEIGDLITITGCYTKGASFPFKAKIGFGNVIDNVVNIKIFNVNILKLSVISAIKNIALKSFLKNFSEYGVKVDKDNVAIDLVMVSKLVPYIYFKLNSITIENETVVGEFEELIYAKNKETEKVKKKQDLRGKLWNHYTIIRAKIIEKAPEKYQKFFQYALLIPDIIGFLWRLFKDERVSPKAKMMVGGMLLYVVNPIDFLPDFIPIIGKVDDVLIAFFGLNAIINEVPNDIILDNWKGEGNIIVIVKEAVDYLSKTAGSKNAAKLMEVVRYIINKASERNSEIEVRITDDMIEKAKERKIRE